MKELLTISRELSKNPKTIIGGTMGASLYYNHIIPEKVEIWGNKELLSIGRIFIPGRDVRTLERPVLISLCRVASKKDIAANTIYSLCRERPSKERFYDLIFLISEFGLEEVIKFAWWAYPDLTITEIIEGITKIEVVDLEPDPETIICCLKWDAVKTTLINSINKLY